MNGKNYDTEDEVRKMERNFIEDFTGFNVTVKAGKLFSDERVMELVPKGAREILDHIRGRGWKITRV